MRGGAPRIQARDTQGRGERGPDRDRQVHRTRRRVRNAEDALTCRHPATERNPPRQTGGRNRATRRAATLISPNLQARIYARTIAMVEEITEFRESQRSQDLADNINGLLAADLLQNQPASLRTSQPGI